MWQSKYASAVPKNLGVGVDFGPCVEEDFLTGVRSPCSNPTTNVIDNCIVLIPYPSPYTKEIVVIKEYFPFSGFALGFVML